MTRGSAYSTFKRTIAGISGEIVATHDGWLRRRRMQGLESTNIEDNCVLAGQSGRSVGRIKEFRRGGVVDRELVGVWWFEGQRNFEIFGSGWQIGVWRREGARISRHTEQSGSGFWAYAEAQATIGRIRK